MIQKVLMILLVVSIILIIFGYSTSSSILSILVAMISLVCERKQKTKIKEQEKSIEELENALRVQKDEQGNITSITIDGGTY
ncbi:hypothetical protein [Bacteroides sp. An51A]|uniref:hypothetical protein n=1 Tax=Bacteroides sp. An51A TaxID=1965640 RepID=UPI000B3A38D6|nr:hypothetical protein [Bacteroides sp. An51A]OUN77908.1 hypothetical protein B5G04_17030 [Bacteroides sp. An51A]